MSISFMRELMNPRSIGIVGASNNPMKMGTMHALSILKDGFGGRFYPVHPTEKTVLGHKAYASPLELPEAPDLALFVLPSQYLLSVFEAFGRIGTKYAIVVTAGFKEAGAEGIALEQRLKGIAEQYGMRFIGPNCMGIINREANLNTTVTAITGKPGKLGFISQSGTYVAQTSVYLQKRGIAFSKAVSVGNEADITIIDVLEYLGEDDKTAAISMYIEAIRDVNRFLSVARKITPHKPVVAQYVGGSEAGGRAGMSHTGAMAGQNHLYDGLFKQAGVIRVYSVEDLYSLGWALATQPRIKGNRIGIITNSGGPGSAIADTLEAQGCQVPPFSPALQEKLRPFLPPHAPCGNPVDMTFTTDMRVMAHTITDLVMKSGEVDGIVMHGAMSTGFLSAVYPHFAEMMPGVTLPELLKRSEQDLSDVVDLPFKHQIPMTVSAFFDREDQYTREYEDHGVPVFDAPEKAARGISTLVRYQTIQQRKPYVAPEMPAVSEPADAILREALEKGQQALDEHASKRLLASYGIPVPEERMAHNADEAVRHATKIGFPVAVKSCDPEILHKTERHLVYLNITHSDGVASAYHEIQASAGRAVPVLVAQMVSGSREFLCGTIRNDLFGCCVAFGIGGILAEAVNDMAYRVAPVSLAEAEEMIEDLRTRKILGAFRGMPRVDTASLADLLKRLSVIPLLHSHIKEIDINPVLISGSSPIAVDALVVLN